MIVAENLHKIWEDNCVVLDDINFEIKAGDIYALVGRSGAGKSTLLRCINGLTDYHKGSLRVDGCEVNTLDKLKMREFRKSIGMIFQQFSLLERKTVYENIALPMRCWSYSKAEIDKKVIELLKLVDLVEKKNDKPRTLSGGQKQRVAIARALTMDPKILLCDEATSALDPKTTSSILELLAEINEKLGITIVIVTHQMSVVQKVCNRISILEDGKIVEQDEVKNLFLKRPPAMQRLLGQENMDLPPEGINLQISYQVEETEDGAILADMAVETGVKFAIVDGNTRKYKDNLYGVFVINIPIDKLAKIEKYLDSKQIRWHRTGM